MKRGFVCNYQAMKKVEQQELENYLRASMGCDVKTQAMNFPANAPCFYAAMFDLRRCEFRNGTCALAIDKGVMRLTPHNIEKSLNAIEQIVRLPVVYVGQAAGVHDASRLVARGIPFVFPGRQLLIPFCGTHVKTTAKPQVMREVFAGCEQLIVLGYLLGRWTMPMTIKNFAKELRYSIGAVQIAFRMLERLGFVRVEHMRGTHTKELKFMKSGKDLWDAIQPYAINPCRRTVGVLSVPDGVVVAGEDALAKRSNLAELEEVETFAMESKTFKSSGTSAVLRVTAPYKVELWHYPPTILGDGEIDTLSLVLSLRDNQDERVQKECETLIKEMVWFRD